MVDVAPGWYPDPTDQNADRWWDGTSWTPHAQPRAVAPPGSATWADEAAGAGPSQWRPGEDPTVQPQWSPALHESSPPRPVVTGDEAPVAVWAVRKNQVVAGVVALMLLAGVVVMGAGGEQGVSPPESMSSVPGSDDAATAVIVAVPSSVVAVPALADINAMPSVPYDLASACSSLDAQTTSMLTGYESVARQLIATEVTDVAPYRDATVALMEAGILVLDARQEMLEMVALADPATAPAVASVRDSHVQIRAAVAAQRDAVQVTTTMEEYTAALDVRDVTNMSESLPGVKDFPELLAVLSAVPECTSLMSALD